MHLNDECTIHRGLEKLIGIYIIYIFMIDKCEVIQTYVRVYIIVIGWMLGWITAWHLINSGVAHVFVYSGSWKKNSIM